jgi:hypothetical protein
MIGVVPGDWSPVLIWSAAAQGHTALAPAAAAASNGALSWAHVFEADAARASDRGLFQVLVWGNTEMV